MGKSQYKTKTKHCNAIQLKITVTKENKGNDYTQLQECIRDHDKDIPIFI
jgi:hypothetical protein